MRHLIAKHKQYWDDKSFVLLAIEGVVLLALSVVVSIIANAYAVLNGKVAVADVILSNIRVFDVDFIVMYGPLLLIIVVFLILTYRPAALPFTIKSISLFVLIRSVFISVTHLGQFTPRAYVEAGKFFNLIGGTGTGGLFFSGHTGVPFLLALIFWEIKELRWFFLATSVLFGAAMLLGHLHYSIDVLGAYFITPTIYQLCQYMFKKDYQVFAQGML